MATEAEWREAYDRKADDLARETRRVTMLITAIEADGHTGRIQTRHFLGCRLCTVLREMTAG